MRSRDEYRAELAGQTWSFDSPQQQRSDNTPTPTPATKPKSSNATDHTADTPLPSQAIDTTRVREFFAAIGTLLALILCVTLIRQARTPTNSR